MIEKLKWMHQNYQCEINYGKHTCVWSNFDVKNDRLKKLNLIKMP